MVYNKHFVEAGSSVIGWTEQDKQGLSISIIFKAF